MAFPGRVRRRRAEFWIYDRPAKPLSKPVVALISLTVLAPLLLLFTLAYMMHLGPPTLWTDGMFKVVWIDTRQDAYLVEGEGSDLVIHVSPRVVAVGSNEQYVVARQVSPEGRVADYWIIDRFLEQRGSLPLSQLVEGPYTKEQYAELEAARDLPPMTELQ